MRSLVTVLVLAAAPAAFADKDSDNFFNQTKYTYCDAKMLSGLWKQSMGDTKARIGRKIGWGGESLKYLDGEIGHAKERARKNAASRCTYSDIGLSYADVKAVADAWKMSVGEVKTTIEGKILDVDEATARDMVKQSIGSAQDPYAAYANQEKYGYCDAKLIGALWKKTADDGKTFIGAKLAAKKPELIEKKLVLARDYVAKHPANKCDFSETPYGYEDAEALAKLWKTDIDKSKATIADKVMAGRKADVDAALKRAKKR